MTSEDAREGSIAFAERWGAGVGGTGEAGRRTATLRGLPCPPVAAGVRIVVSETHGSKSRARRGS